MCKNLVVAIDGPAGAGKSTVARHVARALGCILLDTGAIYRIVALMSKRAGIDWHDQQALAELASSLQINFDLDGDLNRVFVNGEDTTELIRTPEISMGASRVSALPEVRRALLSLQRRFAESGPLVAEGRDMGTVVFPQAAVKVFLVADPLVRARRRRQELMGANRTISLQQVLREQNERDAADSGRAASPLKPASDARTIDTSGLTIDQVVGQILELVPPQ